LTAKLQVASLEVPFQDEETAVSMLELEVAFQDSNSEKSKLKLNYATIVKLKLIT
jgi:hypothetical protein